MLSDTLERGVFSHVVTNEAFSDISARDRAFASCLYLGVLERLIYLDFCINKESNIPTSKMKPMIRNILRMGTYQLMFMDSVPDHAAISESVKLAKKRGFSRLAPFINGVLRSLQREGTASLESDMPVNVRLSVPKWMYELVSFQHGESKAEEFFKAALGPSRGVTVRLNTLRSCEKDIISSLEGEGCTLENTGAEGCYHLKNFESLTGLKAYREGLFSVQDISSVRASLAGCNALKDTFTENEPVSRQNMAPLIIDLCAAPGGKSIVAAQEFPSGTVISRDISASKTALIDENIRRLRIENMRSEVHDATVTDESLEGGADLVIADLPCSGIGVIGGKPDIKFRLREKDLEELAKLQRDILNASYGYVKQGGILLYSTCTVNKEENIDNACWFAQNYPFELLCEEQIIGGMGDGFYIAVFRRKDY